MDCEEESKKKRLKGSTLVIDLPFDCWSNVVEFSCFREFSNLLFAIKGLWGYIKRLNTICVKNIQFPVIHIPEHPINHPKNIIVKAKSQYSFLGSESKILRLSTSYNPLNILFERFPKMDCFRLNSAYLPTVVPLPFDVGLNAPVCPYLKNLQIRGSRISKLRIYTSQFPNLEKLSILQLISQTFEFVGEPPQIKDLGIRYCKGDGLRRFFLLAKKIPSSIEVISIIRSTYPFFEGNQVRRSKFPNLKVLRLVNCVSTDRQTARRFGVQYVDLRDGFFLDDLPSLTHLDFWFFDNDVIPLRITDCPNLSFLKIDDSRTVEMLDGDFHRNIKSLEILSTMRTWKNRLYDVEDHTNIKRFQNLEVLKIDTSVLKSKDFGRTTTITPKRDCHSCGGRLVFKKTSLMEYRLGHGMKDMGNKIKKIVITGGVKICFRPKLRPTQGSRVKVLLFRSRKEKKTKIISLKEYAQDDRYSTKFSFWYTPKFSKCSCKKSRLGRDRREWWKRR